MATNIALTVSCLLFPKVIFLIHFFNFPFKGKIFNFPFKGEIFNFLSRGKWNEKEFGIFAGDAVLLMFFGSAHATLSKLGTAQFGGAGDHHNLIRR